MSTQNHFQPALEKGNKRLAVAAAHLNPLPTVHGTIANVWAKVAVAEDSLFSRTELSSVDVCSSGVVGEKNRLRSPERAVLAQSAAHYELLQSAFPEMDKLKDPQAARSGENLLIEGLDRFNLCIGDTFAVRSADGVTRECILQVSSPRKPCKRWDRKYGSANGLSVRHFVLTNTVGGWFFRVVRPGTICKGDTIVLVERAYPQWRLERIGRKLYGSGGGHIDSWTHWTGTFSELQELSGMEPLAMREWKDEILELRAAAEMPPDNTQ